MGGEETQGPSSSSEYVIFVEVKNRHHTHKHSALKNKKHKSVIHLQYICVVQNKTKYKDVLYLSCKETNRE